MSVPKNTLIHVVAAVITNQQGELLVVRKQGTCLFMQPGGKLQPGEGQETALLRELHEELNCQGQIIQRIGTFFTDAANEEGYQLQAEVFCVVITDQPEPSAEIEELYWLSPHHVDQVGLAPLTQRYILPLLMNQ